MTKLVINNEPTPKRLTFDDLERGDWFRFVSDDFNELRIRSCDGNKRINISTGLILETSPSELVIKFSKVTITYKLEE